MNRPAWVQGRVPVVRASVTTWEIFFDLIFVFAVARLVDLVLRSETVGGYLDAAAILVLTWALYDAYARLTDDPYTVGWAVRVALLLGVVGFLLMAVASTDAAGTGRWPFALAHLMVVLTYVGSLLAVHRAGEPVPWIALRFHLGAAALVLVAAALPSGWHGLGWGAAVAVLVLGVLTAGSRAPATLHADHLAERHHLLIMIALAASVLAVAGGSTGRVVDPVVVVALVCVVALATTLWWLYFGGDTALETQAEAESRPLASPRQLVVTHSLTHLLTVAGLVLLTAGLRAMMVDPLSPLSLRLAVTMATGVALFFGAAALYERRLGLGNGIGLTVTAVLLVPTAIPGTLVSGLSELALVLGITLVHIGLRRVARNPGGVDARVSA